MLAEWLLFVFFGLFVGAIAWWTWRHGQMAQKQAKTDASLADLGREVGAISHDLQNLFAVILTNVSQANTLSDEDAEEALGDATTATQAANKLVRAMRRRTKTSAASEGSTEGLLRLTVAMLRSAGVRVSLDVDGDFPFFGLETDAARLLQNLLMNAIEEARAADGWVSVTLSAPHKIDAVDKRFRSLAAA